MDIEQLKQTLRDRKNGFEHSFKYPNKLAPNDVDGILQYFGFEEQISYNWNGCDFDWSWDFKFEGMEFECWGSGYYGSLVFKKK